MSASSSSSSPQVPCLRVQINNIDYALTPPGPLDRSSLPQVPVIRIYGNSSTGTKACVHIHQVYPYFYVEYLGKLRSEHVNHYITRLTRSLNHAIALSLKCNPQSPKSRYVKAILLVKGIHFYGFHSSYSPFLKILLADPACIHRAAAIMQSGTVMSTRFRIFESHLGYILQFMCDFGLYGCGLIDIGDAVQRCAEEDSSDATTFNRSPHFRQSRAPLELDIIAPQILNRHRLIARNLQRNLELHTPNLSAEPLVPSVRELWDDERNRRRALGLNPSPELPVDPSASSRGQGGEWVAEARWWDELRDRISTEATTHENGPPIQQSWERWTMSSFESVEALWDEHWKTWKPTAKEEITDSLDPDQERWNEENKHEVDVNINLLSTQDMNQPEEMENDGEDNDEDLPGDEAAHDEELQINNSQANEADRCSDSSDPFVDNDNAAHRDNLSGPGSTGFTTPQSKLYTRELTPDSPTPRQFDPVNNRLELTILSPSNESATGNGLTSPPHDPLYESVLKSNNGESSDDGSYKKRILSAVDTVETSYNDIVQRQPLTIPIAKTPSQAYASCQAVNMNRFEYKFLPPTTQNLLSGLASIPDKLYRNPYYSNILDVPVRSREYAGLVYTLKGDGLSSLDNWDDFTPHDEGNLFNSSKTFYSLISGSAGGWEYASTAPSIRVTKEWLKSDAAILSMRDIHKSNSQLLGPTQANIYGFKTSPLVKIPDTSHEKQNMTVMSLELFVPTRGLRVPDPEIDEIAAAFYSFCTSGTDSIKTGVVVSQLPQLDPRRLRYLEMNVVDGELDLLNTMVDIIVDLDPDVVIGWEIQRGSWGYLDARARQFDLDLVDLISRAPPRHSRRGIDTWGLRKNSTFKVAGRHALNMWRIMRLERTLTSYTFENVAFHVLRQRVPKYSFATLTGWYQSPVPAHAAIVMKYFSDRVFMNLAIIEESEVLTKTAEFARVFGVDFFSVLSRGSQFKVESFMFRIAKPESFLLISPSKADVGKQNAAECMPLIMEPVSAFYSSPVAVLDFQSLYPSIMIAYNYCYSTCLGRVRPFQAKYKLGVVNLDIPHGLLGSLQDHIIVAPNGIMYVKSTVRKGLLGRMLTELLDTRVMVKQAMKGIKNDKALQKVLDARQLGLKYIANVTYGYTSASFSGRMPAVEIADSIVQSGRETLEKAIEIINNTAKWGGQVVYGDTDSVFVHLPGKTKEQAFRIGNEIAETITALNPAPIKLKFEKIYLPCVLMAKKRYVGCKYEAVDDSVPSFDAKGIETVRRDGVLAQRKMTETCLKMLFRSQDLSEIKSYCYDSWTKLLDNKVPIQDYVFAKEVRMGTYSDKIPPPPGVMVAARRQTIDPNDEPQYGERVPYVIVKGPPGSRLAERAVDPSEVVNNGHLHLDTSYYINRVLIPPLERIFNLVGADIRQWFIDMPRSTAVVKSHELPSPQKVQNVAEDRLNIDEHFRSAQCVVCGEHTSQVLCDSCYVSKRQTVTDMAFRVRDIEKRLLQSHNVCISCTGTASNEPVQCQSLDCSWFYSRKKAEEGSVLASFIQEVQHQYMLDEYEQDADITSDTELSA